MEQNFITYIALLLLIVIAVLVIKKVASCLIKSIVTIVFIAVGVAIYYFYLR
mgnify:CR=1 FL=1